MTDVVLYPTAVTSGAALRLGRFAARLGSSLYRAMIAYYTRQALAALPDELLRDIRLTRGEIDFVADALASGQGDPTRDVLDRLNWTVAARKRNPAAHGSSRLLGWLAVALMVAVAMLTMSARDGFAQDTQIRRGQYLVTLGGCNDCHTPGYFFGKPDMARMLGGSEVGFEIPGLGIFHGPNLTPDQETGLGKWSADEITAAITKGQRPDGRVLAPIMPWHAFANLTGQDVRAIVAFLKNLPPVNNKVPGPFGPSEKPTSFVMKIVPPEAATSDQSAQK